VRPGGPGIECQGVMSFADRKVARSRPMYRCLKRAAVRDAFDPKGSSRVGFWEVGMELAALERRWLPEPGVVRLRFARGWVSCVSQKGDTLFEPIGTEHEEQRWAITCPIVGMPAPPTAAATGGAEGGVSPPQQPAPAAATAAAPRRQSPSPPPANTAEPAPVICVGCVLEAVSKVKVRAGRSMDRSERAAIGAPCSPSASVCQRFAPPTMRHYFTPIRCWRSADAGSLRPGERVSVMEVEPQSGRVRHERGWSSVRSKGSGRELLRLVAMTAGVGGSSGVGGAPPAVGGAGSGGGARAPSPSQPSAPSIGGAAGAGAPPTEPVEHITIALRPRGDGGNERRCQRRVALEELGSACAQLVREKRALAARAGPPPPPPPPVAQLGVHASAEPVFEVEVEAGGGASPPDRADDSASAVEGLYAGPERGIGQATL
jgi:hypothetical protein